MKLLAYASTQIVPMVQPFICNQFWQLETKLFNIKIIDRKLVISFVATVLLEKFSKNFLVPSELGILVYKDLTSMDTTDELSGIFSILLSFRKKSFVSCILVFVELLAEHMYIYIYIYKNYGLMVSKQIYEVISVFFSLEIFPTIFFNETVIFSCLIFVLKTILCKTLTTQAKTQAPMGILREIFYWRHNFQSLL